MVISDNDAFPSDGQVKSVLMHFAALFAFLISACGQSLPDVPFPEGKSLSNSLGLQLLVAEENLQPTLRIILPGQPSSDRSIEVLFPEHVTVRRSGSTSADRLYMFRPGRVGERPEWRRSGQSIEYERDFPSNIQMLARATLEDDGVRFQYQFKNGSDVDYDLIYAPTDPRLTYIFHDVRLERTYVHHTDGFDLLASETLERLTIPLEKWLPSRYLAAFTWPVPDDRIENRDGILHYHKSRAVDQPFIATVSSEGGWVVASFSRESGNVWSNPELTCQHVDPMPSLPAGEEAIVEIKMLVLNASVQEAFNLALQQRPLLR